MNGYRGRESAKIAQLIDMLDWLWNRVKNAYNHSFGRAWYEAYNDVARKYGVTPQSVIDKYLRGLRPAVNSTEDYTSLVRRWLASGDPTLREVLISACKSEVDRQKVRQFFDDPTKPPNRIVIVH